MKKTNLTVRTFSVVIFLFYLYCTNFSVFGQTRNTITGYVFAPQRRIVSDVRVELINGFDSVIQRVKTDGSGRFFFSGVPGGRLSIRVLTIGTDLEEQTQEVEVTNVGALGRTVSDYVQIDFYLRLRKTGNNTSTINGVTFIQEIPKEAEKLYEKAITELADKKIELGTANLENALKAFPDYYLALEKLGQVYIGQQKYENAKDIFTRAVAVNARSFNSWYGLSYANLSLQQTNSAIEAALKAVSLNTESVEAFLLLGISQRQGKQYKEAEKSLKQCASLSKGVSADAHWNLALLYAHNLKRYDDAAEQLELYLKVNPNVSNAATIKKLIKQFRESASVTTN